MGQPLRGEYVVASPLAVLRSEDQPSGVIRKNGEWDGEHHSAAAPSLHAPLCWVLCVALVSASWWWYREECGQGDGAAAS